MSNTYLWIDEAGLMLVDSGRPGDADTILNYVQEIGRHPSEIEAILITHADYDHAGSAARIQEHSGATIYAGPRSAELLSVGKSPKHMPGLAQFIIDRFFHFQPVPEETIKTVSDGETLPAMNDWHVLATPGHTRDHHAFFSSLHGILFAGDALNTRGGRLQCTPKRISADIGAARQSAMRLLKLHPALIACGHGRPMGTHSADDTMRLYRELQSAAES